MAKRAYRNHTDEGLIKIARGYGSIREFREKDASAFKTAKKRGLLGEFEDHVRSFTSRSELRVWS